MAAPRVAVVGGGLAGLAAAARLRNAGSMVELYERSRLLGGRATSFEVDGHVVDNGQHVYLACCTEFIDFVREAGMEHCLHLQERFDVEVFDRAGRRERLRAASLPAPLHLVASFLRYRFLGWRAKVQVVRALIEIRRYSDLRETQTFAEWLQAHGQGEQAVRAFWEPFLVPALNAPLERMSAAEAAFVISTAFLRDRQAARFGYTTVPLAEIMETAARPLHAVHRSTAVLRVEPGPEVLVRTATETRRFDAVVLAVPPQSLQRILADPASLGIPPIDAYEAFPIMDVHLWHDRGVLDFDFAALLDARMQWIFQKAPGYLCCSVSAAGELWRLPNTQATALAWEQLRERLPQLAQGRLLHSAVTRNPAGTYLRPAGAPRPRARTSQKNVALAGAWTATGWPDTMESAVRSGRAAACALTE